MKSDAPKRKILSDAVDLLAGDPPGQRCCREWNRNA